jgi:ABC-type polysaccharide/polyol phosphate transport system ATPase subunit
VTAIQLSGVGKRYWKLDEPAMLLRSLLPFSRPTRAELWALRGIDLTIDHGEVVGVIGGNGAGKTTLLRMLAGVTRPTEGRLRVEGRIAPLISVGVGFHREMSGRENVYINGMLLGLSKPEVDTRFDDIIEFAELEEFVDTPVKFYSSGMYMRLGFSVAMHTDPQVLLVDEVLAVGDLAFQMKSLDRMREIRQAGATIVLVSHSMQAIRLLCPRAVVIRRGEVAFDGDAEGAVASHLRLLEEDHRDDTAAPADSSRTVTVLERTLLGPDGPLAATVESGTPLRLRVRFRFERPVDSPVFSFGIDAESGTQVYVIQSAIQRTYRRYEVGDEAEVVLRFEARLLGGGYRIVHYVLSNDGSQVVASDPGTMFFVNQRHWAWGLADLNGTLAIDGVTQREERSFRLADQEVPPPVAPAVEESL